MSQEIIGVLGQVMDVQVISDKFSKRDFILTIEGTYPQHICFQLSKDKIDLIEVYKTGEKIRVHYNLRGREYQGRYFNTLEAWRIERMNAAPATNELAHVYDTKGPDAPGGEDDLPF